MNRPEPSWRNTLSAQVCRTVCPCPSTVTGSVTAAVRSTAPPPVQSVSTMSACTSICVSVANAALSSASVETDTAPAGPASPTSAPPTKRVPTTRAKPARRSTEGRYKDGLGREGPVASVGAARGCPLGRVHGGRSSVGESAGLWSRRSGVRIPSVTPIARVVVPLSRGGAGGKLTGTSGRRDARRGRGRRRRRPHDGARRPLDRPHGPDAVGGLDPAQGRRRRRVRDVLRGRCRARRRSGAAGRDGVRGGHDPEAVPRHAPEPARPRRSRPRRPRRRHGPRRDRRRRALPVDGTVLRTERSDRRVP